MELIQHYFTAFTPLQLQQLQQLNPLYAEWNEKINVISRKDFDNFYDNHVLHSLCIAALFNFTSGSTVLDLGTGGGFPGVPLAIFFPQVNFLLVDSIAKKLKVINAIASTLNLTNISTRHSRVEDLKNTQVDYVVSRAVAPLQSLWRWSKPLLKKNATLSTTHGNVLHSLICLKGGDLSQEIVDSQIKPRVWPLEGMYNLPYYKDKYVLQVVR